MHTHKRSRIRDDDDIEHINKRQRVVSEYNAGQECDVPSECLINVFPFELLKLVFSFIDIASVQSVSLVNKRWRATLATFDMSAFPFDQDVIKFFSQQELSLLQYAVIHNMYQTQCGLGYETKPISERNDFEYERSLIKVISMWRRNTAFYERFGPYVKKLSTPKLFDVTKRFRASFLRSVFGHLDQLAIINISSAHLRIIDNEFDLPRFKCFERLVSRVVMVEAIRSSDLPLRFTTSTNLSVDATKQLEYLEHVIVQYPEIVKSDFYYEPLICRVATYDSPIGLSMAKLLIERGASRDARSSHNELPWSVAMRHCNIELAEFLHIAGRKTHPLCVKRTLVRAGITGEQYNVMMEKFAWPEIKYE